MAMDEAAFQGELLGRLPLAEAVLSMFSHVLAEPFLADLFDRHRGQCYERELSFAAVAGLIRSALLEHDGSARACFEKEKKKGRLPVTTGNAYGKLSRLPLGLSVAFLAEGAKRVAELMPQLPPGLGAPVPASLSAMEVVGFDGKKLKKVAKRLKLLRGLAGKVIGAKLLVAMDVRTGLALAMGVSEDGESNDVPLVPALLPQVRQALGEGGRPILWVADAQFCDLGVPSLLEKQGGHFLLRYTPRLGFHPDPSRPARAGVDARGRSFVQEWGWVGGEKDKRRRYVRRVTLSRPGDADVAVITDLTDERAYPAVDLLEVYLLRWGIENVFQQVVEVFGLRKLIGSSVKGMVFQSAFCLLLYDMIQVCKAYAARAGAVPVADVSGEKLFVDVTDELVSWATLGDEAHAARTLAPPPTAERLRARLAELIGGKWTPLWLKHKNKGPRAAKQKAKSSGAHTSVWRALNRHDPDAKPRIVPEVATT